MPVNRVQLMNELMLKIQNDEEVRRDVKDFAEKVKDHWQRISPAHATAAHPWATGAYRRSITRQSEMFRNARGHFQYRHWVGTYSPIAEYLEYGTGVDVNGTGSWIDMDELGRGTGKRRKSKNTPTPEFAYAARTALHFHGTAP